ncbi:D-alanyl-D-alanine carboxypeptidase family protein [Sporofaciens sp. SGI.106]|uniref:D-alanyl-D-alanine carboxypeptidase family protein n=1 Tax=Sporofaciens sp. SGI.106 TaxID=3420568 RepID=UPI002A962CEE|nr:D-alanyl-D-alanine carboxypeptidase [Lachnoclostridium sp.]
MRCTGRYFISLCCMAGISAVLTGCGAKDIVASYEMENYNKKIYEESLYAEDLCVSDTDISIEGFHGDSSLHAAALFDLNNKKVVYSENLHERNYPASTTKILTALVAMENSSMDDVVTIGSDAAAASFAIDAQVCGLQQGDQITMEALLNGLLLHSGNDNAVAIAEYIGGSVEGFVNMMNERARSLMATNTHFVTPNGLHDENHYTTAYDLYLIFNECIRYEEFIDIISSDYYTADITGADGSVRQVTWYPTSFYAKGEAALPSGAQVIGGKTGYTGEAGNCLILLDEDAGGNPYISIVLGAESKPLLYEDMTAIIDQIPNIN